MRRNHDDRSEAIQQFSGLLMGGETVSVLIVDDQTLFRSGLARLLADDGRLLVLGEAENGLEALQQLESLRPDVVLMDLKMPVMDGLEATRRITGSASDSKILILSELGMDWEVLAALEAGASGYVLKDAKPDAVVSSILAVSCGEQVLASEAARSVLNAATGRSVAAESWGCLTSRELVVLRLIATGYPNRAIAQQLGISDKTVRNYASRVYEKLHIADRSQAVLYAARRGLVQL